MQNAFAENTDSKFRAGEYEYDINIRYGEHERTSIDDVKGIKFINGFEQTIRLDQFAIVR